MNAQSARYICDTVLACTVHTEHAEMAAVSCGTSHAGAVSTPLVDIQKRAMKKLITHAESHASAVSLLESRE